MSTETKKKVELKINLSELKMGDEMSEVSHYRFVKPTVNKKGYSDLFHLESQKIVSFQNGYIAEQLYSANQYKETVTVGKEDKYWTEKQVKEYTASLTKEKPDEVISYDTLPRVGDLRLPGIRSIWDNITTSEVWECVYNTKGEAKTKKKIAEEKEEQLKVAAAAIEKARTDKKSMTEKYMAALRVLQENPIQLFKQGDERTLRGYKVDFNSITGFYNVVDMEITEGNTIRKVNINEIKSLIYKNVKYIVE